jgi:hypothetical protein
VTEQKCFINIEKHSGMAPIKTDVERQLERSRIRRVDNNKINFKELGCEGMDLFNLVHNMAKWWAFARNFVTR